MGELGKCLGIPVGSVTDLRLSSKADDYDPLSSTCFAKSDEYIYEVEDEEAKNELPEGLDSVWTVEQLQNFDSEDEETEESDI